MPEPSPCRTRVTDKERVDALIPPGTCTEDYYRADFGPHPSTVGRGAVHRAGVRWAVDETNIQLGNLHYCSYNNVNTP